MSNYVLAIDCGGTFVKVALIDKQGNISERNSFETELNQGTEVFVDKFAYIVNQYKSKICAAGIAFAAPLDPDKGTIEEPPNFPKSFHNFPLIKKLEEKCHIPFFLENDANLAALGEYWLGQGKNSSVLVVITLGTGVGGGIIINGEIWNGSSGIAGEVGHIPVYDNGPVCGCGNIGCLETFASSTAVVRMAKEIREGSPLCSLKKFTAEDVYKAALSGDSLAKQIFVKVGNALGKGIVSICHVLGPEKIILTGGGSGAWDLFSPSMKETISQMCFKKEKNILQILPSDLQGNSGILGAGYLAWKKLGITK
ncbi:MAG: ROK family protein [Candidatus Brocadiae bacterium]|nr:ROK family protein [Candidatus Brocadiia bacterium]